MKEKNKQEDGYLTFFENIKKHPYLTILLLIVIFIVIPISFYVENPLGLGFIPPDIAGNVLEYYGAILGGLLTLIGVAWTIKYVSDEKKLNSQNVDLPIIDIKILSCRAEEYPIDLKGFWTNKGYKHTVLYEIKNIGKVASKDITVSLKLDKNQWLGATGDFFSVNLLYAGQAVTNDINVGYAKKGFNFSISCKYKSNNEKDYNIYKVDFEYRIIATESHFEFICDKIKYS